MVGLLADHNLSRLTPTQIMVYLMVIDGMSNQEIADVRFIDVKSVKAHVTNILKRLGFESRAKMTAKHYQRELEKLREQFVLAKTKLPEGLNGG